jgi:dipeptidyl aminopeptidase/acylaminoacyl peptidase
MRIGYDPVGHTWGKLETVISSADIGLSITEPRVSPDGRFLLFTAANYSQFPLYLSSCDLYLLDLRTGKWKRLEINSDKADSFHSWSSNSRWMVFSSKRMDGLFSRPYFSHIDTAGNVTKPFVLPQEDPAFYESCIETYNVPEFTRESIRIDPQVLVKAAFFDQEVLKANLDPVVTSNRNMEKAKPDLKIKTPSNQNTKNSTTR